MLRIFAHLIATAFRVFGRLVVTALFCAALGAGAVLLITAVITRHWQWPPSQLTIVLLVGVAVLAAYAGGVTVLMIEAVRGLTAAARAVEREAVAPLKAVEQEVDGGRR
jgi:hypothetical protein